MLYQDKRDDPQAWEGLHGSKRDHENVPHGRMCHQCFSDEHRIAL